MKRRIGLGIGAIALAVAGMGVTSGPAQGAELPVEIGGTRTACLLHLNLWVIPPICIG